MIGLKDATGNVLRCQELVRRLGDRLVIMSGDDALTLGMMACGARGLISTTSNLFPRPVSEVCRLALAGDWNEARRAQLALLPVYEAMFIEANPGPLKFALSQTGRINPAVRLPLVTPGEASRGKISEAATLPGGHMRIALHGATGRMGKEIVRLVHENRERGYQIVGAIAAPDAPEQGSDVGEIAGIGHLGVSVTADHAGGASRR